MKRIVLILLVTIFFISINVTIKADEADVSVRWYIPFSPPSGIEIQSEDAIKEFWPDSVLFSLNLFAGFPIAGKDFSSGEYYMVGEEIIGYSFHIKKFDSSTYLSNITVTFIAPNDDIYYKETLSINLTKNDWIFLYELENQSFIFDNKGLWKFSISFKSNKMNLIWKETAMGTGLYQTFQPTAYHNGNAYIFFYNFYNEGIPVLSGPEVLQVSQNAYIAQQTVYLNKSAAAQEKSAKGQENLSNSTENLARFTFFLAFITIISVIVSIILYRHGLASQRKALEQQNQLIEKSINKLVKVIETRNKSANIKKNEKSK